MICNKATLTELPCYDSRQSVGKRHTQQNCICKVGWCTL